MAKHESSRDQGWKSPVTVHPAVPAPAYGRVIAYAACFILLGGIFVADTLTRYEIAIAAFYSAVILAMSRMLSRRAIIGLGCACALLTVFSFLLSPGGALESGIVNSSISLVVICITTYLVVAIDTARTAAQRANEQLMRIGRIQSLHGLTSSIAHEINQPLAAIVTSAEASKRWLQHAPPQIERASLAVDRILVDATRAGEIIGRVRRLTRGEPPRLDAFDINEAIREILSSARAELDGRGIELVSDLQPGLPRVRADRVQLQQVFSNLLLNAAESLAAVPAGKRRIRVATERGEDGICCTVADSGPGIPPDVRQHLFEAFWSTKAEGIGVGLSLSRAMIEANGGAIWAVEQESVGAIFRFRVPAAGDNDGQ